MKTILLTLLLTSATTLLQSQTIELPGMGTNNISVSQSLINSNTQLTFGNAEYSIISFKVKFATTNNPEYSATSPSNHFTSDMISNIHHLLPGNDMELVVTLKSLEGESVWDKSYVVHVDEE